MTTAHVSIKYETHEGDGASNKISVIVKDPRHGGVLDEHDLELGEDVTIPANRVRGACIWFDRPDKGLTMEEAYARARTEGAIIRSSSFGHPKALARYEWSDNGKTAGLFIHAPGWPDRRPFFMDHHDQGAEWWVATSEEVAECTDGHGLPTPEKFASVA